MNEAWKMKPFTLFGMLIVVGMFVMWGLGNVQGNDAMEFIKYIVGFIAAPVMVDRYKNGGK